MRFGKSYAIEAPKIGRHNGKHRVEYDMAPPQAVMVLMKPLDTIAIAMGVTGTDCIMRLGETTWLNINRELSDGPDAASLFILGSCDV